MKLTVEMLVSEIHRRLTQNKEKLEGKTSVHDIPTAAKAKLIGQNSAFQELLKFAEDSYPVPSLRQRYIQELKLHDWYYDMSDDHRVWVKGKNQRHDLGKLQIEVDPNFEIWNQYAPDDFKVFKTW